MTDYARSKSGTDATPPDKLQKVIAVLQIIGGTGGIIMAWTVFGKWLDPVAGAVSLLPASFAIYAGLLLWKGKRTGVMLSALLQVLQVVKITTHSFTYLSFYGFGFFLGIQVTDTASFVISPHVGGALWITGGSPLLPVSISFNLVAIVFLVYLLGRWHDIPSRSMGEDSSLA